LQFRRGEKRRGERLTSTNHPLSDDTRRTIIEKTWWCIQRDDGRVGFTIGRHGSKCASAANTSATF